jgi:hypothetical protein
MQKLKSTSKAIADVNTGLVKVTQPQQAATKNNKHC